MKADTDEGERRLSSMGTGSASGERWLAGRHHQVTTVEFIGGDLGQRASVYEVVAQV